jgi:tripartite-type tricarboxylate transporter receptor subunit TctC
MRRYVVLTLVVCLACVASVISFPGGSQAATWPEKGKIITLIVPFGAGGATDIQGRMMARSLEKTLGTPVQVVNKPGADTQIGLTEFVKARADGYTIVMTNLPTNFVSYLDPERKAIYGRKDLVQVANQVYDPQTMTVRADSPYKTLKDLIDAAKAKPESIRWAIAGHYSNDHLATLLFEEMTGARFSYVKFDGNAPAMPAILGGHLEGAPFTVGVWPSHVKSREVRVLAVMDKQRSKFLPDVPTLEEQGYKFYAGSQRGYSVRAGTPKEIIEKLAAAIKMGMESEEIYQKMDATWLTQRYMDAAEYTRFWDEQEALVKPLLEKLWKEAKQK